jgi:hypothetical protein
MSEYKFAAEEVTKRLAGAVILGGMITPDGEAWGFEVELKDGTTKHVWVDCDPEGNGPGWLAID